MAGCFIWGGPLTDRGGTSLWGQVDILLVALHKGMVHTHAELQMYERPLMYSIRRTARPSWPE